MDPTRGQSSTSHPHRGWAPGWARVLAWIALVPAALGFILGVRFIIQGFGPETLAAVGFIVGPLLILLTLAVAVPALVFLRRGGKVPFFMAIGVITLALLLVVPNAL